MTDETELSYQQVVELVEASSTEAPKDAIVEGLEKMHAASRAAENEKEGER